MAVPVVLNSFGTLQNSSIVAGLNANNQLIENGLADCLSLTGQEPNAMNANLDMNSFQILNLPAPATINSPVRLIDVTNGVIIGPGTGFPGITPDDFGASGNGIADDTVPVQTALNSASVVYFPAGKTYLTSNLVATRNVRLQGYGPSSVIKFKVGSTGYNFDSTSAFACQIDGIAFDGGSLNNFAGTAAAGTRSGVHLWTNFRNVSLSNSYIHGYDNLGVGLNGDQSAIWTNYISNNIITNNWAGLDNGPSGANHDVSPGGSVGSNDGAEYLRICNNGFFACRNGFILTAGNTSFDSNIVIKNNTNIYLNGTGGNNSHSTITGNLSNHGSTNNVFSTPFCTLGVSISGNQFWYGSWTINQADGITVTNNTIAILPSESMTLAGTGWYSFLNNWFHTNFALTNTNTNTVFINNWCNETKFWYTPDATKGTETLQVDSRGTTTSYNPTTVGGELITNGNFASGANWALGTGWTISGGALRGDGTQIFNQAIQAVVGSPITANTFYLVSVTISGYVGGSIIIGVGGTNATYQVFGNGTFSRVISSFTPLTDQNFYIDGNLFNGNITNVSLKKFLADGTFFTSHITGNNMSMSVPNTQTGAAYTVVFTDSTIIVNLAGTHTLTLPSAATSTGRILNVKTIQAQTVVSATSNVVPLVGGAAGTAILAATAGKWATLQSDGTNWVIIAGN